MTSLPPALLEQLLSELSTLASVYHKPPESFVGKGRFGADEILRAAIQEQRHNLAENPIAASVTAAANGTTSQSNMENLLDIDFDGAAPASAEQNPTGTAISELGGAPASSMADMMGLFDMSSPAAGPAQNGMSDIMSGFTSMDLTGSSAPPPAAMPLQEGHSSAEPKPSSGGDDLLGLF